MSRKLIIILPILFLLVPLSLAFTMSGTSETRGALTENGYEDAAYLFAGQTCNVAWTLTKLDGLDSYTLSNSGETSKKDSSTTRITCTTVGGCSKGYIISVSTCSNDCTSGDHRCSGNIEQTCGNYDTDSCTEWPASTAGSGNDDCSDCSCSCGNYDKSTEVGFCSDSKDNDCDGTTDSSDSDCSSLPPPTGCTPTATQVCGSNVGECQTGTKTCDSTGSWGTCVGEITAVAEVCGDSKDNDCDGAVDDGCSCTIGETRQCGSDVGECDFGEQVCGSGATWGECIGEVKSSAELCSDNKDNDCDGKVDKTDADCYGKPDDEIPEDNPEDNGGVNPIDHSGSSGKTWTFVKNNPVVVGVTVGAAVLIIGLGAFYFLRKKQ